MGGSQEQLLQIEIGQELAVADEEQQDPHTEDQRNPTRTPQSVSATQTFRPGQLGEVRKSRVDGKAG